MTKSLLNFIVTVLLLAGFMAAAVMAAPVALPMTVSVQTGQTAEFAPLYKGIDTTCTAMVPVLETNPLHGTVSFVRAQSWNWYPRNNDSARAWSRVPVSWFHYTPATGFTGLDSFTYRVNYGPGITNVEKCIVRVHPKEPGGMMVLLVVNDALLPNIMMEVGRLKSDLENEGYVARIKPYPNSQMSVKNDTNAARALWDTLLTEYNRKDRMVAGTILIGQLPTFSPQKFWPVLYKYTGIWDDPFWNMSIWFGDYISNNMHFITRDSVMRYTPDVTKPADTTNYPSYGLARGLIGHNLRHIWVTRMAGVTYPVNKYGTELNLIKRQLDANHDYRTGVSRFPHRAWVWDMSLSKPPQLDWSKLGLIWPAVTKIQKALAPLSLLPVYSLGGDYFDINCHGAANQYDPAGGDYAKHNEDTLMNHSFQCRFLTSSSCHSANPGDITNKHLFTRGGGCVFSTSATEYVAARGFYGLAWDYTPNRGKMRTLLAAGERWGRTWINSGMPVCAQLFYGDGSLKPMMFPSNEPPVISAVTATSFGSRRMRITVKASDEGSLALYEYWINRKYDKGRNEPDTAGSALVQIERVFDSVTTVRVEVVDNYKARVMKEFVVVPDSGIRETHTANESNSAPLTLNHPIIQPNPFNPVTTVYYTLAASAAVEIRVVDTRGCMVTVLRNGPESAGRHSAQWNGRNASGRLVANGLYFLYIKLGQKRSINRITYLK